MARAVVPRDSDEAITWWQGLAGRLRDEVGTLRLERDELTAQVGELRARLDGAVGERDDLARQVAELTGQLEAAKAELIKLTLVLRHESERRPRPEGDGDTPAGEGQDRPASPAVVAPRRRRGQRRGAPGHGRRRYDHLPTTEEVVQPDCQVLVCPDCGRPYAPGPGEDVSEELDCKVVITRVIHRRPRWHRTCACPAATGVVAAPAPPKVIPKGRMSVGMLARLLVAKYVVGLPASRLALLLGLEGVELATGTLAGVFAALAARLAPLAAAIRAHNATSGLLHIDETSWPVFVEVKGRDGHRWWLWVFVGPDSVAYVIVPGRGALVAARHLGIDLDAEVPALPGGRSLVICSDFYSAYQSLGNRVAGVTNAWCWAHIRRRFVEAGRAHPATCRDWAARWVERIGELFGAHRGLVLAAPGSHDAGAARAELARVVHGIDHVRRQQAADPHTPRAGARVLATLEREWEGLMVPIAAGIDLDNNAAERALRSPVVGRKNYYGSGAAWSAQLAADAWSITATVALAGWNPLTHLEAYLRACAANGGRAPAGEALTAFLPWGATPEDARAWVVAPSASPTPDPIRGRGP